MIIRKLNFGRVPSGRAIAQYLSWRGRAQYFKTSGTARPERILAHIPHALRLVHSADKSGDHISTARQQRLRAGSREHSKMSNDGEKSAVQNTCLGFAGDNSAYPYTLNLLPYAP